MQTINVTRKECQSGKPLSIILKRGQEYSIIVTECTANQIDGWWVSKYPTTQAESDHECGPVSALLEMEDTLFNHSSAVPLPQSPETADPKDTSQSGTDTQIKASGLIAVASSLLHMHAHYEEKLTMIIAGHTDTSGQDSYNTTLSKIRTNAIYYICKGDADSRKAWMRLFKETYYNGTEVKNTRDLKVILKWASQKFTWDCDPGVEDHYHTEKTTSAIRSFQQAYNDCGLFSNQLVVDGTAGQETWGAFFDTFQFQLAKILKIEPAYLAEAFQNQLVLNANVFVVGCGEKWPMDSITKDNYRSQRNRRVEFLFFEPSESAALACCNGACMKNACPIYSKDSAGNERYTTVYIKPIEHDESDDIGEY